MNDRDLHNDDVASIKDDLEELDPAENIWAKLGLAQLGSYLAKHNNFATYCNEREHSA